MKYAITYALDDTWESVDTLLVETDTCPLDMPKEEIADIFEAYTCMGRERALVLAKDKNYWFVRNVEDTDVDNTKGEAVKLEEEFFMKALEDFIFDRLGDMADPLAFKVLDENTIVVSHSGLVSVPMDVLLDEWNKVKKGTEFEKVKLFVPAY